MRAYYFLTFRGPPEGDYKSIYPRQLYSFSKTKLLNLYDGALTEYEETVCENVIFKRPAKMQNIGGYYISQFGVKQFRCAETEKHAHVTFLSNSHREGPSSGRKVHAPAPSNKNAQNFYV
jgi:2,3-bisphosphoglycerate-independent phosphoglycerate mutase